MGSTDRIISAESDGNPYAQNPNSSAGGLGQIIDSTWMDLIRQHRPDITGSEADILKLKFDPVLNKEMTDAYSNDNGKILANAGHPVTPGNTYLAHFAGPQGAVSVLNADPSTPVSSVLTAAAVKANPFLQGMTVSDLQAWANRKMGAAAPTPGAAPANPPMGLIPQQPAAAPRQQIAFGGSGSPIAPAMSQTMAQAPPIFFAPPKQIDLSRLKAAFAAPKLYGQG